MWCSDIDVEFDAVIMDAQGRLKICLEPVMY